MNDEDKGLQEILGIAWRRRWLIILTFLGLLTASVLAALLLPPVYRSSATILIEEPDVPRELVTSTITGFADQRLQIINQRVMATQNLLDIIRKYDLYAEQRQSRPVNEVIDLMRQKITMNLVSADVRDPQSGRTGQATIAFTVSFDHGDPQMAQRVANELVSLYMSENLRERQEKSSETATFLAVEARRLENNITDLEKDLSDLKVEHAGSLPEQRDYNQQSISRAEQELRDLERRAQTVGERMIYLQSQLAQISPYGSYAVDGQRVLSPTDQLKALRTQLATISGRYGPDHPDVIAIRREVEALGKVTGTGDDPSALRRQLQQIQSDLAKARERYTEDHPEVIRLKREADSVRAALTRARTQPSLQRGSEPPDNPAYVQMQAELQGAKIELEAISAQQNAVLEKISTFEKMIEQTPLVERDYQQLMRALEAASAEYRDIRSKQTTADLGQSLETERKSERFSLLEPPQLPTEPIKPNRRAIAAIGFILSLGGGVGLAMLREGMDTSVYSPRQLASITGSAPLATIPYIRTRVDRARAWRLRAATSLGALALLSGALVVVHLYLMPLDVLWSVIQQRLESTTIYRSI